MSNLLQMPIPHQSANPWCRLLRWYRRQQALFFGDSYFRLLAETIPQIVWTATEAGLDYCNQRWFELTGQPVEQALGKGWQKVFHPDDLPVALRNWESGHRDGTPVDAEYRLRTPDGSYRWHLIRAIPVREADGVIVRWFGSCTDIQEQMHEHELLEKQIKQYTAALLEANTRLESEMRERALAQQELDRHNERMMNELTLRSTRATTLARLAQLLQSCAGVEDVLSVVADMAPALFPGLRGAVLLLNSSRQMLDLAVKWADCILPDDSFEPQKCQALRRDRMHDVASGHCATRCAHAGLDDVSCLCIPLLSQGEAIGVLHFQVTRLAEIAETDKSLAVAVADQIALSIANLRLREALRNQSIRDPLTGLFNRRYLEETMERETRRAVRAEHGLGVLMLDLDHFKQFNDTYGHDAGDTVLRETSSFLVKSVRAEDIICRFGGEEFVIILPMADLHTSQARAERIRCKIRELSAVHQGQSLGRITVSIGVAALPGHGTTPKELLAAADAALYRAKRAGRDRVLLAGDSPADGQDLIDTADATLRAGTSRL